MWGGSAFAEENKWKYEGKYLTAECFVYEWVSSDNFEEFYDRYFPSVKNSFSSSTKKCHLNNNQMISSKELEICFQNQYQLMRVLKLRG